MKTRSIMPFALEYPNKYFKDINTKKEAIQKLIYAISKLYDNGISFKTISNRNGKYYNVFFFSLALKA
ncbi:MAG: hypothetical protein ACOYU5_10725 [Stygiobacter sp.]